ncbi:MAG TPA: YifB family Mg chelatase-like AAA ATPase [Clostridiaceae bacterium]|nr:YifB family Mg chelatase-like AAA ATPase [Clostridiaceae bacterium]
MRERKYSSMMSCGINGIYGLPVEVEVTILPGLPSFEITGLGDSAVREARNRVRAAIINSGYKFPQGRIVASYAPAWIQKRGTGFDLPLALAILEASGQIARPSNEEPILMMGELSLKGALSGIPGILSRLIATREKEKIYQFLGPLDNIPEAELVSDIRYYGVEDLRSAVAVYSGIVDKRERPAPAKQRKHKKYPRFDDFVGQDTAKRALTIAAAGHHTLLMLGSPGCGKTSLASCLPGLLPPLSEEESLIVTMIQSALSKGACIDSLLTIRPFLAPHHSVTAAALIGGGLPLRPGLCTAAHLGVLFLDELTEFSRQVLDLLREPLESKEIRIARAGEYAVWPANFLLIAAANPCRCGYSLEPADKCRCTPDQIKSHLHRVSGPLWDRLNLCVKMQSLSGSDLLSSLSGSAVTEHEDGVRQILTSREIQARRAQELGYRFHYNADLPISDYCRELKLERTAVTLLANFAAEKRLSARVYHNMLRGARTIADLEQELTVKPEHIAEIIQYRLDLSTLL